MEDLKKYIGQVITVWTKEIKIPFSGKLLECGSETITINDRQGKKIIPCTSIRAIDL